MNKTLAKITAPTGDVMVINAITADPFAKDFSGKLICEMIQNGVNVGRIEYADAMSAIEQSRAAGYTVEV